MTITLTEFTDPQIFFISCMFGNIKQVWFQVKAAACKSVCCNYVGF